jgi:hypothetical protein
MNGTVYDRTDAGAAGARRGGDRRRPDALRHLPAPARRGGGRPGARAPGLGSAIGKSLEGPRVTLSSPS